jgi:integrase
MARRGTYLYKQGGSENRQIKLQYPKGSGLKTVRKSLGTPDKKQAEIIAAPMILEHKQWLYTYNLGLNVRKAAIRELGREATEDELNERFFRRLGMAGARIAHQHTPMLTVNNPDGTRTFATETEVFHIGSDGKVARTEENEKLFKIPYSVLKPDQARDLKAAVRTEAHLTKQDADRTILETWRQHRNVRPMVWAEAERAYGLFKELTNGVAFANATRDDGRKLVNHFLTEGKKSSTIEKLVGHLRAAVNLAIDENKLRFNPFSDIVPNLKDAEKRLPFSRHDMALIRGNLDKLRPEDRHLLTWLVHTGMRLSEPYQIEEEFEELNEEVSPDPVRYVIVGTKTDSSLRRVPIPDAVLPYLPAKIVGPLFTQATDEKEIAAEVAAASKRLNRFLRSIGIKDTRKVVHGFRHTAKDRLRAVRCPKEYQLGILGHDKKTVADDYGTGESVVILKEWIEKIGW